VFIICWRCPYISEKCPFRTKPKGKGICIVVVTHVASTPGAGDERFEQFMVCAGVRLKDYVNLTKSVKADLDGECKLLYFCHKAFDALADCTDEHGNASGWSMAEFERQTGCAFVRPAAVVRADADLMHTVVVRVSYGANKSMRCTTANRFFFANETNLGSVFMFPGLLYKWLKCAPRSLPIDNAVITRLASLEAIAAEEQRRYNLMIRCASARACNFPPLQSAFLCVARASHTDMCPFCRRTWCARRRYCAAMISGHMWSASGWALLNDLGMACNEQCEQRHDADDEDDEDEEEEQGQQSLFTRLRQFVEEDVRPVVHKSVTLFINGQDREYRVRLTESLLHILCLPACLPCLSACAPTCLFVSPACLSQGAFSVRADGRHH
jgi:hypothetical protein